MDYGLYFESRCCTAGYVLSSYGWSGAYGWSLGVNGQLYEDGVNKGSGHPWKKLSKQYIKSLSIFGNLLDTQTHKEGLTNNKTK